MKRAELDSRLRLMQDADLKGKVVLVRVDHNVVNKGRIKDPYRIDATIGTLYAIAEKGGRPVLMTHVGRPRDKKTGAIACKEGESVRPIVQYLEQKLPVNVRVPEFDIHPEKGILHLDPEAVKPALDELRNGRVSMVYLPNTRWFQGEQAKGPERDGFAEELAGLADVYVNDAFGSWQPHASTYDVARLLPSYAGTLLQRELASLHRVLEPRKPFLAVVAGAKYDTKLGPLKALYGKVDRLILGGVMYNTYLSAKYGIGVRGVSEEDVKLAEELVDMDKGEGKILELPLVIASETSEEKARGRFRRVDIRELKGDEALPYVLDVDPESLESEEVKETVSSAGTIFVNAVMGLTPHFWEGSEALYRLLMENREAKKFFGGGDTLQELRALCPGPYMDGLDDPGTYYFTGGGSVLTAVEQGTPYGLKPVEALMG